MYKLVKSPVTGKTNVVNKQVGDVLYSIPFDPANTDYQAFLRWCEEGNQPEPAEEQQ
jgi:hypothetical protein